MKLYIPEESQYMYTETLRQEEIVSFIGQEIIKDENGQYIAKNPKIRKILELINDF